MLHFYSDGQGIISDKHCVDCLIVLIRGEARVIADDAFLVTRRTGSVIGEQALVENVPRRANRGSFAVLPPQSTGNSRTGLKGDVDELEL